MVVFIGWIKCDCFVEWVVVQKNEIGGWAIGVGSIVFQLLFLYLAGLIGLLTRLFCSDHLF